MEDKMAAGTFGRARDYGIPLSGAQYMVHA